MGIQKLIVFGTGQIAEVAANYIKEDKNVELIAFTVEKKFLKQKTFLNYPVVPFEDLINTYNPKENLLFAPLSYKNMNAHRIRIFKKGKALGYKFYSFIHKNCVNYSKSIGENCFILENNVIQPFCVIEDNCIIAAGAVLLENTTVPAGSVWAGVPAKKVKDLSPEMFEGEVKRIAKNYRMYASWFEEE